MYNDLASNLNIYVSIADFLMSIMHNLKIESLNQQLTDRVKLQMPGWTLMEPITKVIIKAETCPILKTGCQITPKCTSKCKWRQFCEENRRNYKRQSIRNILRKKCRGGIDSITVNNSTKSARIKNCYQICPTCGVT